MTPSDRDDVQAVARLHQAYQQMKAELARVIVGQAGVIDELLIALFARGHCLLEGVPGLAKTLLVRTLAGALTLDFRRIQFTPDLMPADITGTEVIQEDRQSGLREFRFLRGPLFGNVILADEINRAPPKTQAALLEAMQEYQVTAGGRRHELAQPFFVLATQNPIEQEGTYPLPEAQLDRFMLYTCVDYPNEDEELEVVRRTTVEDEPAVSPLLDGASIVQMQRLVRRLPAAEHVLRFALRVVRLSRPSHPQAPALVREFVTWGAGPRAAQSLVLGAKARAALQGRLHPTVDDLQAVALPVLRHRIIVNFNAEAEGVRPERIVGELLELASAGAGRSADDPVLRRP